MMIPRLRNRYLSAMGLSSIALTACSANEGPTEPITTPSTGSAPVVATAPPSTATAIASVPLVPTATAAPVPSTRATVASWTPTVLPKPVRPVGPTGPSQTPPNFPSCPSGKFCVAEADATGTEMAKAPYAHCATQVHTSANMEGTSTTFDEDQTKRERTARKDACCYSWYELCPGGRPLVVAGAPRLAAEDASEGWLAGGQLPSWGDFAEAFRELSPDARRDLREHYAREASFEHASIASFARVSLDLLALGAPARLITDTQLAGLEEIAHAEATYRLASACGGAPVGPGRLDVRGAHDVEPTLARVAEQALVEGCWGEVAAALVLREEAARAIDPAIEQMLLRMAADEEGHAELAWRTVAWALERDPRGVRTALEQTRESLVAETEVARAEGCSPELALPGLASPSERRMLRFAALSGVVLPCLDMLLSTASTTLSTTRPRFDDDALEIA